MNFHILNRNMFTSVAFPPDVNSKLYLVICLSINPDFYLCSPNYQQSFFPSGFIFCKVQTHHTIPLRSSHWVRKHWKEGDLGWFDVQYILQINTSIYNNSKTIISSAYNESFRHRTPPGQTHVDPDASEQQVEE